MRDRGVPEDEALGDMVDLGVVAPSPVLLLKDLLISAGSKKEKTDFDADIVDLLGV